MCAIVSLRTPLRRAAVALSRAIYPREYLNPTIGWRFRFPFPEEDGVNLGCFEDYDKGVVVAAPRDMVEAYAALRCPLDSARPRWFAPGEHLGRLPTEGGKR